MNNPFRTQEFTVGARRTAISATLKRGDGTVVNLTGHTVTVRMVAKSDNSVKVDGSSATVDDAAAGEVSYSWGATDLDTAGDYWFYWIVTRTADSKIEYFPGDGPRLTVKVVAVK